ADASAQFKVSKELDAYRSDVALKTELAACAGTDSLARNHDIRFQAEKTCQQTCRNRSFLGTDIDVPCGWFVKEESCLYFGVDLNDVTGAFREPVVRSKPKFHRVVADNEKGEKWRI